MTYTSPAIVKVESASAAFNRGKNGSILQSRKSSGAPDGPIGHTPNSSAYEANG